MRRLLSSCAVVLAASTATTAGTLEGRMVTFTVMTWDDPAAPYVQATGRTVQVGQGIEFALGPEGLTGGLDVAPVQVEIGPARVELTYPPGMGTFFTAAFNGYVLRFDTECVLFQGVRLDPGFTTMAVTQADITTDGRALYVNVSGRDYREGMTLGFDLDVTDCPLS